MNEALVPHAQRLRIGRSNFCLLSDIKSKESTLQLIYDVLLLCPFFKAFVVTANVEHKNSKKSNEMYYPRFTKVIIHHFMSKDLSIPRRNKFGALLPIELTNEEIKNSNAYKEYYAIATRAAPPKPKASVRRTRSSSDPTITPPTAVVGPRQTTSQKGKQAAKASKAKSLSALSKRRVKDLQLGVESYQKKLNLTKPDSYRSDLKCKEAYTAYSNPRGFIYQNKDKKNRLMRIDELHKFSDGTLTDVRNALDDRLKGIQMQYLPQSI
nr:hypothetical protein [Tanacetum cinerariifolium]